jgi:bifunctional non-homologous end joining protein LigD
MPSSPTASCTPPPYRVGSQPVEVEVEGHRLKLSNLEKVLYPQVGFTKGEVIDYYTKIAPAMLPHLHDRPITLKRYPNGVDAQFFYEKQCPKGAPAWVRTEPIWSTHTKRTIEYCLVNDLATLTWLANLAALELHPLLSKAGEHSRPTSVVFDLDPGPPATSHECAQVALWLREIAGDLGLACFPKTSGSKGIQVYIPLNTPVTYETTSPFAHDVARLLEAQHPDLVVSRMAKDLRGGKVFIDWSQNDEHKTTAGVYSLRARPEPTVSTPLEWAEIEAAAARGEPVRAFVAEEVLERVREKGDLFAPVAELEQALKAKAVR